MFLVAITLTTLAVVVFSADPTPPGKWTERWKDDFDGTTLNKAKWSTYSASYSDGCRGNKKDHKLEYNLLENLQISDGTLKIQAKRRQFKAPSSQSYTWTSGLITTGDSCGKDVPKEGVMVKKGDYIQVRAKLPGELGMWPAFWTWNKGGNEVDVFEHHPNNPKLLELSNHTPKGGHKYVTVKEQLIGQWHYYGAYLGSNGVAWYLDGRKLWNDTKGFNSQGAYLIVDLAVADGKYHPAPPKGVDKAVMEVDSVKVFKQSK